ncbi:hypothetical protein JZ751_023502, partial [Albula glossodonta]
MVVSKKLAKESQLPSVLEDNAAEMESELLAESEQLGGIGSRPPSRPRKPFSRGSVDNQTVTRLNSDARSPAGQETTDQGSEEGADGPSFADPREDAEAMQTASDQDYDTDLELE